MKYIQAHNSFSLSSKKTVESIYLNSSCQFLIRFTIFILFGFQLSLAKAEKLTLDDIWTPYFQSYSVDDGLSQSQVLKVVQDQDEFLWLLTPVGVDRFNGFEFESIPFEKVSGFNSHLEIIALLLNHHKQVSVVDSYGRYYVFDPETFEFKLRYSPKSNQQIDQAQILPTGDLYLFGPRGMKIVGLASVPVKVESVMESNGVSLRNIESVIADKRQTLWLSSYDGKLFSLDTTSNPPFGDLVEHQFDRIDDESFEYRNQVQVTVDIELSNSQNHPMKHFKADNNFVIAAFSSGELYRVRHKEINGNRIGKLKNLAKQPTLISTILKTSEETLWLGTRDDGVFRISLSNLNATNYRTKVNQPGSLISNNIDGLFLDKQGQLWINSSNGISFAKVNNPRFYQIGGNFAYSPKLASSFVTPMYYGPDNTLWTGSPDSGVSLLQLKRLQVDPVMVQTSREIVLKHKPSPVFMTAIDADNKNRIWVGSDRRLQWFDAMTHQELAVDEKWLKADVFGVAVMRIEGSNILIVDDHGRLAYQQDEGKLYHHQIPNDLKSNPITAASEPYKGIYWLAGTDNSWLYQFNSLTLETKRVQLFNQNGSPIKGVISLSQSEDNTLWIGTQGEGILRKDLVGNQDLWLDTANGLPDNTIYALLPDSLGNLWITSNKGLSRLNIDTQSIHNFDKRDGIQSNEFNGESAIRNDKGWLFFGGINGITVFDEKEFALNQHQPKTYIQNASLFTNNGLSRLKISEGRVEALDYHANSLTIKIGAIDLVNQDAIQYSYRLMGQSEQWTKLGNNRNINFMQLPAGDYQLQVTSCNSDNICNAKAKTLDFIIPPAPWATVYAYLAYFFSLLFFVGFVIKKQKDKIQFQKALAENEKNISSKLRSLNRLKDEFLANTSHELRTPLNGIIGLSEMLQIDPNSISHDESQQSLAAIRQSGIHLNELVNDLLDFSQFHNKRIRLNQTVFNIGETIYQVTHLLKPLILETSLSIEIDLPEQEFFVYADENRIRQVLYNLLNNAIKFSDTGLILVSVRKENGKVVISVKDEGIGIAPEKQRDVFISFTQVDGSNTRNKGGVGLGLAICRDIMELHGSDLTLKSAIGEGSVFSFSLPSRGKI